MGDSRIIQVTLKAIADMSDVTSNVKQIQNLLSQMKLPPGLQGSFEKIFGDIEKNVARASQAMANGFKNKGDVNAYSTAMEAINKSLLSMQSNMQQIKGDALKPLLTNNQELQASLKQTTEEIGRLNSQLTSQITGTDAYKKIFEDIDKIKEAVKAPSTGNFFKALADGDLPKAEQALKNLERNADRAKKKFEGKETPTYWVEYQKQVDRLREAFNAISKDGGVQNTQSQITLLEQSMKQMSTTELDKLKKDFEELTGINLDKLINEVREMGEAGKKAGESQHQLNSELSQLKSRISYFFGMTNAVMLFRRALRSTFETVKDLDKVMTETAVVTEFDVGDMWTQLPEYTERANQLGVSIHDAYEAATLYYQQGLSTNEVMAVSNETLKMARIAGLDAADATDRMTNALRGFNMEITESNAQNINDVYSNLAAKTASNVDEISTAMTKVASLAHNANMSFENTAAFLSQIIETTRESAETAGTALKTVIARFSEVKKLYSTGDLLGTDEEGEEINVNKVSAALRTAGINLNEYLTGMKGLDEIFMELSEKWDSLDQVQQRYIATMAAGSRQQSRFIALMQDNARMTELVGHANNAAGASEKQFEKTLESLESKLNELKNSWKTFLMGIANSDIIKVMIDALKNFLDAINNLTSALPGLGKSLANITIAVISFTTARALLGKTLGPIAAMFKKEGAEATTAAGGLTIYDTATGKAAMSTLKLQNILMGFGSALLIASSLIDESTESGKNWAKGLRYVGIAIAGLGAAIKVFGGLLNALHVKVLSGFGAIKIGANAVGTEVAKAGFVAQAGWAWIALAVVAISGLVYGAIKLIQHFNKNSPEQKLKDAQKATEKAKEAADEAKESYDNLNSSVSSLKDQYSTLETLTKGTEEWRDAVKETNDKVLELIGNYAGLGKYVHFENGVLKIDFDSEEVQQYMNDSYKNSIIASVAQVVAEKEENRLSVENAQDKLSKQEYAVVSKENNGFISRDSIREDENSNKRADIWNGYEEQRDLISKALAHDQQAMEEIERKYGVSAELLGQSAEEYLSAFINSDAMQDMRSKYENIYPNNQYGAENTEIIANVTKDNLKALTDYGSSLIASERAQNSYNEQILTSALVLSNLEDEEKEFARNYFKDSDIEQIKAEQEATIEKGLQGSEASLLYDEWAEMHDYEDYEDYRQKNNYVDAEEDDVKRELVAKRVTENIISDLDEFDKALENMPPILKRVYEASEGQALTLSDTEKSLQEVYAEIKGIKVEDIKPEAFTDWRNSKEGQDYARAQEFATQRFAEPKNVLEQTGVQLGEENYLSNISSDMLQGFTNKLISVIASSGPDAAKELVNSFEKVMASGLIPEEFKNTFLEQLNIADWNDLDAVEGLVDDLKAAGLEIRESDPVWQQFIQDIKDGADSIKKFDLKSITNQADNLAKIQKEIRENKDTRSFSEDDYNAMMSVLGSEWADKFVKDEEGNYRFIGGAMENLADALNQNTSALLEEGVKRVDTKIGVADILKNLDINDNKFTDEDLSKTEKAYGIQKMIQAATDEGYSMSSLGIEGLSDDTSGEDLAKNTETLDSIYTALMQIVEDSENGNLDAEKKQTDVEVVQANARNNTAEQNAEAVGGEYGEEYAKYLLSEAEALGVDIDQLNNYRNALLSNAPAMREIAAQKVLDLINIQKEIELYGLDSEAVKAYATDLQNMYSNLSPEQAMNVALANTKLNEGLKEITDSYDDWTAIVDENTDEIKITGSQDSKVYNDLRKSVNKMLNTSEDLSDEFFKNTKNMKNLKKAAKGDKEAIEDLQKAASMDYLSHLFDEVEPGGKEALDAINNFATYLEGVDIPQLEAGVQWDDSGSQEFIGAFNEMARVANLDSAQIQAAVQAMGFDAEIEYVDETRQIPVEHTRRDIVSYDDKGEPNEWKTTTWTEGTVPVQGSFPVVKTLTASGAGGGGVSTSGAGGGGGGGGGGCFAAGTLVTLQGFYKNIEQVSVGDVVLSYNEEKKKNEYSTVVQTMIHLVKEKIYTLYVGRDKLVVTGIHRFYITREEEASWIPAEELCVGDKVRFADGTLHDITKISTEEKSLIVYNFEVSNTHNYYVGRSQILAHNKGGGGGGKDKSSHWENPYDELFNLEEKINSAIRQRNKLEEKYNDLLLNSKSTTGDVQKANKKILKNLQKQLTLQNKMKKGRLKQIKNVANETYYDDEGNATTFAKMKVTKYASLDTKTGEIHIDWKGLEKLSGDPEKEAQGKAAEAYISRLQELADQLNEANESISEIKEQQRELHKQNLENVTDFQQRAMDAYIDTEEKRIDAIEEMYDAIEESTQNVLQGIQDQIAAQRQARENDKTEKNIADKEARLAYLQRDTSGANQAEIMSLQKEIDEARQDYEDSLIDQTIDQMSKDADLAAEQRSKQIEIMREQLETAIENGTYWKKVNKMIDESKNKDGTINKQSKLWKMIENSESYKSMSEQQQYQFRKELLEQELGAFSSIVDTNRVMVMSDTQRKAIATAIAKGNKKNDYNGWGSGKTRTDRLTELFGSNDARAIENLVKNNGKKLNTGKPSQNEYKDWKKKMSGFSVFKTGGLADFTGPAWLDGTKTKPEIILNAADSKNLIILKDVLASLLSGKNSSNSKDNGGDNYFDIDITAELKNDYDVDQLAARIKKQIQQDGQYRNVNAISFLR